MLQDDMVRAQSAAADMNAGGGFFVDHQGQLEPSPYGAQALFDTAGHSNISMYGDSQSLIRYGGDTASMQFPQLLTKPSAPTMQQYLSGSYQLPFGGPMPSQLLLQALQTKPSSRNSLTVKVRHREFVAFNF